MWRKETVEKKNTSVSTGMRAAQMLARLEKQFAEKESAAGAGSQRDSRTGLEAIAAFARF
jgi:hypothetical protein